MFKQIGRKLMRFSKIIFWVGIAVSLILVFIYWRKARFLSGWNERAMAEMMKACAWRCLLLGPLLSWAGSWSLYALGQITEDTHNDRQKENSKMIRDTLPPDDDLPEM